VYANSAIGLLRPLTLFLTHTSLSKRTISVLAKLLYYFCGTEKFIPSVDDRLSFAIRFERQMLFSK
jgi:hypothetical protein